MNVKYLLFDLDGTLTDPKVGITTCIQYALAKLGYHVPETNELLWCIGPPLLENFKTLLGDDYPSKAQQALALYRERFGTIGKFENEVYPGIPACLAKLKERGYHLFVATSKPHVFAKDIIAHFHLARFFSNVYGSELNGDLVDKGELIHFLLKHENISANETIMIGDRKHDIIGAKKNGVRSIGVEYGYGTRAELTESGADFLVKTPGEIIGVLHEIPGSAGILPAFNADKMSALPSAGKMPALPGIKIIGERQKKN